MNQIKKSNKGYVIVDMITDQVLTSYENNGSSNWDGYVNYEDITDEALFIETKEEAIDIVNFIMPSFIENGEKVDFWVCKAVKHQDVYYSIDLNSGKKNE